MASTDAAHPPSATTTRPTNTANDSDPSVHEEDEEADVVAAALTQDNVPVAESSSMAAARRHVESPAPAPEPKRQRTTQGDRIAAVITALIDESERQCAFEETAVTAPPAMTNVERAIQLVQERCWLSMDGLFALQDFFLADERKAGLFLVHSRDIQLAWLRRELPDHEINDHEE